MKPHGNKVYIQVLLDPCRAALLQEMAQAVEQRPSQYLRDLTYWHMEELEPQRYRAASLEDTMATSRRRVEISNKRRAANAQARTTGQI